MLRHSHLLSGIITKQAASSLRSQFTTIGISKATINRQQNYQPFVSFHTDHRAGSPGSSIHQQLTHLYDPQWSEVVAEYEYLGNIQESLYGSDGSWFSPNGETYQAPISLPLASLASPGRENETAEITNDKSPGIASILGQLPPTLKRLTLAGKVAIVTGGARGLGYSMAQALAEAGTDGIAIMDVRQESGDKAAEQLSNRTGVDARFYQVDIRDSAGIMKAIEQIVTDFGRIDVLVNSAGVVDFNLKAEHTTPEQFRRVIDTNLTGAFFMCQAVARYMISSKIQGSLILIASMSASVANYPQQQSAYGASKAGVVQLARSLAAEWARYNIRVNCISPGYVDTGLNPHPELEGQKKIWTELTPLKRLGHPDELGGVVVWLASESSAFATGSEVKVDGGYTVW